MLRLTARIDVSTPDLYYDPRFRILIEQHLADLKNYKGNTSLKVEPIDLDTFDGNLYGYLFSQRVPVSQHWIIMRMNGMDSTLDFNENHGTLILPYMENVDRLREIYNTVHKD